MTLNKFYKLSVKKRLAYCYSLGNPHPFLLTLQDIKNYKR